ncbi:FMN-binding negative transcriptional regulator [Ideonella sp. A 288]|uniref:FMN-binding negative transcriptional regulator n=1 Tax=Ideonella sp. A 288 TaxID=1962181 RepID=UPI000B4C003B|nr:FMN-binding negative transcriptional regulator [Ideonella sp. A 288]
MYLPVHFEITDTALMQGLIRAHPLGAWASAPGGELVLNHVPFMIDATRGPHGTLVGHVARANPLWQRLAASIVAFQGPQAYVSPSSYPSKQAHGKVVPTWNYAVVHAHGTPRAIEDKAELLQIVGRLTRTHESGLDKPWAVSDAPADYIDTMLGAIVGIEIPIDRLVGKWKVSQNRSAADRQGVADVLAERGDDEAVAMAGLVVQHGPR